MIKYGYSFLVVCATLHGAYASWAYPGIAQITEKTMQDSGMWSDAAFAPLLFFPLMGLAEIVAVAMVVFFELVFAWLVTVIALSLSRRWFPSLTLELLHIPWYAVAAIFGVIGTLFMMADTLTPGTTTHPVYPATASKYSFVVFVILTISVAVNVVWLRRRIRKMQTAPTRGMT